MYSRRLVGNCNRGCKSRFPAGMTDKKARAEAKVPERRLGLFVCEQGNRDFGQDEGRNWFGLRGKVQKTMAKLYAGNWTVGCFSL